ncbi:MAG: hypothetical protein AMXMBFR84_49840 [Candidatus Hydrogenedentota bacterium]
MESYKPRWTMRGRILAAVLMVSILPLLIIATQGYHCASEAIMDLSQEHLLVMLRSSRDQIEARLNSMEQELNHLGTLLAGSVDVASAGPEEIAAVLERYIDNHSRFLGMAVVDSGGTVLGITDGTPDLATSIRPMEHPSKDHQSLWILTRMGDSGEYRLCLVTAVGTAEHRPNGASLVGIVDVASEIGPAMQSPSALYTTAQVMLFARDKGMLMSSTTAAAVQNPAINDDNESAWLLSLQASPPKVVETTNSDGRQVMVAVAPMSPAGWLLGIQVDRSEAMKWLQILVIRIITTVAITLAFVFAAVWAVSRFVGRPLNELVWVASRIQSGHYGERLRRQDTVEGETFRQAFNLMMDTLKAKQMELVRTEALASVGELTASIVHEMRNPLSSIKINTQVLARAAGSDVRYREMGQIVLQQVDRLENMLTDMLHYSRPLALTLEPVLFDELAAETCRVLEPVLASKGITLRVIAPDERLVLMIDREQVRRVFSNILENAADAIDGAGWIRVCAERHSAVQGYAAIHFVDNGPGLTEEGLARASEPFYTNKLKGTGLGLANVKKIAELHGGSLIISNRSEGGLEVTVTLPIAQGDADKPASVKLKSYRPGSRSLS